MNKKLIITALLALVVLAFASCGSDVMSTMMTAGPIINVVR